jgi:hypothetical protein
MKIAGNITPVTASSVQTSRAHDDTGTTSPKPAVVSVEKLSQRKSTHLPGPPSGIRNEPGLRIATRCCTAANAIPMSR